MTDTSQGPMYQIKVTATNGRTFFWHKQGKIHLLPAELAGTWVEKFKPHLFDITLSGEMVGAGRDPAALKIMKVEQVEAASSSPK